MLCRKFPDWLLEHSPIVEKEDNICRSSDEDSSDEDSSDENSSDEDKSDNNDNSGRKDSRTAHKRLVSCKICSLSCTNGWGEPAARRCTPSVLQKHQESIKHKSSSSGGSSTASTNVSRISYEMQVPDWLELTAHYTGRVKEMACKVCRALNDNLYWAKPRAAKADSKIFREHQISICTGV